ncbi:hypothetical protein [Cupriavidus necator]
MNTTVRHNPARQPDLAQSLVSAWTAGLSFAGLPVGAAPASVAQAYDVQARVVSLRGGPSAAGRSAPSP